MTKTILKYHWPCYPDGSPRDVAMISMGARAEVLHVAEQRGQICLWARVDVVSVKLYASEPPTIEPASRIFLLYGTGGYAPDDTYEHVGTVLCNSGNIVWHIFQPGREGGG